MDIIRDILDRVFRDTTRPKEDIERELRNDYGGDTIYVPKSGEKARAMITMRNAAIRADWQRGERVEFIMRRYSISRIRVYQIVKDST